MYTVKQKTRDVFSGFLFVLVTTIPLRPLRYNPQSKFKIYNSK